MPLMGNVPPEEIAPKNWRKVEGLRTLRKSENRTAIVGRVGIKVCIAKGLLRENRQVLGDDVAKVRAEHADVEAPAVTDANDGLRIELDKQS